MPNLELRPLLTRDAPHLFALIDQNRSRLAKFWWEAQTQTVANSYDFIQAVNTQEAKNGAPTRGICVDEQLVGVGALHTINWQERRSIIGYWIDKDQSGKGYTTAATRLLINLAFEELSLKEVCIVTRASNAASRAIAERLGFTMLQTAYQAAWNDPDMGNILTTTYRLRAEDAALAD